MKLKSLMLHLDSLSLRKKKVTFLRRRVSAFIALARDLTHIISKIAGYTLFVRAHCQIL